jgi:hypothetical protein
MKLTIPRRLLVAVAALAMTGAGLNGAQAVETPVFSDAAVFSGCVNVSPGVGILPNNGTFNGPVSCAAPFNVLPTLCTIVSNDEIPPVVEGPYDCASGLAFQGTYANTVCGTGTASGTATVPEADGSSTITFLIAFVAGQGVLVGNSPEDDGWDVWTGPVNIVPTAPLVPPCPVTQFRVTAAATAVDSPVPVPLP